MDLLSRLLVIYLLYSFDVEQNSNTILILAAGKGQRMGSFRFAPKVLLPLQQKAILSHIFSRFSKKDRFLISVGYCKEDIAHYCQLAHPELNIQFIAVENYEGPNSGPGTSALAAKSFLKEPFYLVCGDTLWDEPLPSGTNWLGTSPVAPEDMKRYCMIETVPPSKKIQTIYDKPDSHPEGELLEAFNGLCHIHDTADFFEGLEKANPIRGEIQLSSGFQSLIKKKDLHSLPMTTWKDLGTHPLYCQHRQKEESMSFQKQDELFYQINQHVIKFHKKPEVTRHRSERLKTFFSCGPEKTFTEGRFFAYERIEGHSFYEQASLENFERLLSWLDEKLWHPKPKPTSAPFWPSFYKAHFEKRLALFLDQSPDLFKDKQVNHITLSPKKIIELIPWGDFSKSILTNVHGDLQFDNILCLQDRSFKLIDWRPDFQGIIDLADIYYDLAKLLTGIRYNMLLLKKGHFSYSLSLNEVFLSQPHSVDNHETYIKKLANFCEQKDYSFRKTQLLSSLMLMNMAPLHPAPFSHWVWHWGLLDLKKWLDS